MHDANLHRLVIFQCQIDPRHVRKSSTRTRPRDYDESVFVTPNRLKSRGGIALGCLAIVVLMGRNSDAWKLVY
jgi:hypothetical protein